MNTLELSELAKELETLASRMEMRDVSPLVMPDRCGMRHNTRLNPPTRSFSSTAAFVRLRRMWPTAASNVAHSEVDAWTEWIRDELNKAVAKPALTDDPSSEKALTAAFRIAYGYWALGEKAPNAFAEWAGKYCESWLLRNHPRWPVMYLLVLVSCVLENSGKAHLLLKGVAEDVIWRQLASFSHSNPIDFEPIELALGLKLCASSLSNRDYRLACTKLNEAAHQSGTWIVRPHRLIPDCSSLFAVLACIDGFGNPIPEPENLIDSVVAHANWLLGSTALDKEGWLMSDLTFRIPGVEPWFNFLALEFARRISGWLSNRYRTDLLRAYAARSNFENVIKWDDLLLESDELSALTEAFVKPAKDFRSGDKLPYCTAILFGPPGTAKTTVAEALASEVNWPLMEIGVSDFLAKGLDSVFMQSKIIFEQLFSLNRVVVLLDEVEGVFASREDEKSEAFQKLLTSSLLPYLKRLRDRASIILLIATNHIKRFDSAVQRPGRIDLIIPVGPPSKSLRKKFLQRMGIDAAALDEIADHLPDTTTIGELLVIKRFEPDAKKEFGKFVNAWKKAHGDRYLISKTQFEEFQSQAKDSKRLS